MVSIQRIFRDYREAGSVNSLLALWGFVDDVTFLTKAGHVGMVFRLAGVDYECLDDAGRRAAVHRFEAALRVLDEHCRIYQYLCKRRIDPIEAAVCDDPIVNEAIQQRVAFLNARRDELYEVDLYLVLVYEGIRKRPTSTRLERLFRNPQRALREWLSTETVFHLVEDDLNRAVVQLHQKAAAFEGMQRPFCLLPFSYLGTEQLFALLGRIRNSSLISGWSWLGRGSGRCRLLH